MRPQTRILAGMAAVLVAIAGFLLYGCQEVPEPTSPEFSRTTSPAFGSAKGPQALSVSGGGPGSGQVTMPELGDDDPLECKIIRGTAAEGCTQTYPWKSSVTLTGTADPGNTFAGWSGACSGTAETCTVVMSQSRSVQARFSGSGVPSFTLTVAGAGNGNGIVKSQAGLSPAIACTITAGTGLKGCSATYPSGTSVRLTAKSTKGTFKGWSGDCSTDPCTLSVTADRAVTASVTAPDGPEATVGSWDAPAPTPVISVHLNHLMDGKVLLFGHLGEPFTWNPADGQFTEVPNNTCTEPTTTCELWCGGHTFLADGRLLVAGGHNEALGDKHGINQASIFDGTSWTATGSMTYLRWYPTLVTLETGDVVALAGTQEPGVNVKIPERYNGSTWTPLSAATWNIPYYPRAFLEPKNGWVFYAGEARTTRYLNPNGTGKWTTVGSRVVGDRTHGSAVMLDGKVLYIGGGGKKCPTLPQNTAEMIDLNAASPTWSAVAPMVYRRRQTNATILPDGTVLVTGGTSACGQTKESGAVFAAELYEPPPKNTWTTLANASVVRVYHSTTLLLPDGRVLSTGSGDAGGATPQRTYEIFSPPYLFKGPRPTYDLPPTTAMHYGQPLAVPTPDAATIRQVTLIRLASTTHAFDQGQLLKTLSFEAAADGQSLTVTAPATGRLAPPGPYLLFIINDQGVPSIAQTVLLSQ